MLVTIETVFQAIIYLLYTNTHVDMIVFDIVKCWWGGSGGPPPEKFGFKVAYTSGPIFEKIIKRYPIFSLQINHYQIDQKHK